MGLAETAELAIKISLTGNAKTGIRTLKTELGGLGKSAGSIARGVAIGAGAVVGAASAVVVKSVRSGLESLAELESAVSSVDAALSNSGLDLERGGLSGSRIAAWANEIEAAVGAAFDDKAITQATTTLIRFGNVTESNLRPAMQVMTDLATKTGDVDSAATLLAKALADPTKAAGKLARQGIILTDAEQKQIAAMVEAGDAAGAQKVILDELAKSTQGAAAASQGPYARSLSVLRDVTEDAQRALATGFLPVIEEVRNILSEELAKPGTLNRIKEFGTTLAGGLRGLVQTVRGLPWNEISTAVGGIVDLGKNLGKAFLDLPAEAKTLILSLAALNKLSGGAVINVGVDILKGAGGALFQQFLGKGSPANPMFVVPVGGNLGGGVGGAAVGAAGGRLSGLLGSAVKLVLPVGIGLLIAEAIHEYTDPILGPILRDLPKRDTRDTTTGTSIADRALQSKLAEIKESNERNRIAVVSQTRDSKTAIVAGAHSDRNAIVSAIRGIQRPIVNVNVSQSYARITYSTGTTLSRYSGKLIPTS